MKTHRVDTGYSVMEFVGELLAEASSKEPDKVRWVEFQLYRTHGGNYVLTRLGRTLVDGEHDRHWAVNTETARGVVDELYQRDESGTWYLTRVARELLDSAISVDSDFRATGLLEIVD